MQFEWSREKAQTNATKHGVTFLEARTVDDPEHSGLEARFLIFGGLPPVAPLSYPLQSAARVSVLSRPAQ